MTYNWLEVMGVPNYKKMYFSLMNAVTAAIEQLENAQLTGEAAYVESEPVILALTEQREE